MSSAHLEEKCALERRKQWVHEREQNLSKQLQDNLGLNIVIVLSPPEPFLLECYGPFGRMRNEAEPM